MSRRGPTSRALANRSAAGPSVSPTERRYGAARDGRFGGASSAEVARVAYRNLHGGVAPKRMAWQPDAPKPRLLVDLGSVERIRYRKVADDGVHSYEHKFLPSAAPVLAHDERGQLHTLGGRYAVTPHGIEDHKEMDMAGYRSGSHGISRRSSKRARRNPTYSASRDGRARSTGRGKESYTETFMDEGKSALIGGAVALGTIWLLDGYVQPFAAKYITNAYVRPLLVGVAGVAAGAGTAYMGYPALGAGIAIGAVIDTGKEIYNAYVASQVVMAPGPGSTPVVAPVIPVTAPVGQSGRSFLPAGAVPGQYQQATREACAQGVR